MLARQAAGFEDVIASLVQCYNTIKEIFLNIYRFEDREVVGKFAMFDMNEPRQKH
jgi:hypothetical protein